MKNEPLNLKEIKKLIEECAKNYEIFGDALIDATFIDIKNHLKSAVQGLLQEINKNIKRWEETMEKADETTRERIASRIDELEFCKDLVKKWMPDVVEVVGNESSL